MLKKKITGSNSTESDSELLNIKAPKVIKRSKSHDRSLSTPTKSNSRPRSVRPNGHRKNARSHINNTKSPRPRSRSRDNIDRDTNQNQNRNQNRQRKIQHNLIKVKVKPTKISI